MEERGSQNCCGERLRPSPTLQLTPWGRWSGNEPRRGNKAGTPVTDPLIGGKIGFHLSTRANW